MAVRFKRNSLCIYHIPCFTESLSDIYDDLAKPKESNFIYNCEFI